MLLRDFLSSDNNKIIITDTVSNVNKLVRDINKKTGKSISRYYPLPLSRIANELVGAYNAIVNPDKVRGMAEQGMLEMIMAMMLKQGEYTFLPAESKGMPISKEILRVINQIRMNETTSDFEFSKDSKITELKQIIRSYETKLDEIGCYDYCLLLRDAVVILKKLSKEENTIDKTLYLLPLFKTAVAGTFFTDGLSALENEFSELLKSCTGMDMEAIVIDEEACNFSFFRSYGEANEVRKVLDEIIDQNIPFGDVAIMYPSAIYEGYLSSQCGNKGIKYAFTRGISALNTDIIQFLVSMIDFAESDYSYELIEDLVKNSIFRLSGARKSFRSINDYGICWKIDRYESFFMTYDALPDTDKNKEEKLIAFVEFLKKLIEIFKNTTCSGIYAGMLSVAFEYTYTADPYRIQFSEVLKNQVKVYKTFDTEIGTNLKDNLNTIRDFLESLRLSDAESSDSISIIPYGRYYTIDRNHLYVLGMSGENVEKTPMESPVLSDEELRTYIDGDVDFALLRNIKRRKAFINTLKSGVSNVTMSYSSYDTVALLSNSPAILFLDMLEKAETELKNLPTVGYDVISNAISINADDFKDYYKRDDIATEEYMHEIPWMSSTSLQTLLACPLRYYYKKIMHIPDDEFQNRDASGWLLPFQKGNLVHHTLDRYVKDAIIDERFVKKNTTSIDTKLLDAIFEDEIERLKLEQPYPSLDIVEYEADECYQAIVEIITALHDELNNSPNKKQVISSEIYFEQHDYAGGSEQEIDDKKLDCTYHILLNGSVDRMDGYIDENDNLILEIYDYKTGGISTKQKEIEEEKQIQHYVYAIAMLDWADKHRMELNKLFGVNFKDIRIGKVVYVFPFDDLSIIDVTASVTENDQITLPQSADGMLMLTEGCLQHNIGLKDVVAMMTDVAKERIRTASENKDDHCKYCNYKNICRAYLRGADYGY